MLKGADASVDFLQRLYPTGYWTLTAIQPDRKAIETRTFTAEDADKAREWVGRYSGKRNIYFQINQPKEPLFKKAEKTDIGSAHYLHVDLDCRAGEPLEAEYERLRKLVVDGQGWPDKLPRATIVVFSGGGYQCFWRLDTPVEIAGSVEAAEEFERYNKAIELALGGDHCHNVDRIMRLPGTLNIPDEKKLKKGRVPVEAELVLFEDRSISLSSLIPVPKVQQPNMTWGGARPKVEVSGNIARLSDINELDQWNVDDRLKVVVVQGRIPDPEDWTEKQRHYSRSEWVFYAVCNLLRKGVPDEVIYSIITDPQWGISAHILAQKNIERYAVRQIERAKEHVIDPMLQQLNERFAVVKNLGGKCRVVEEVRDEGTDRNLLTKMTFPDFQNAWLNRMVQVGTTDDGAPIFKPAGKWWLEHPMRREYDRLMFAPGRDIPGVYNLWQGFRYQPIQGDCSLFLQHIRENICDNVEEHYDYLIRWLARTVQFPAKSGQSAIVLRGRQGTGKSFFVKNFGALFGRHFLQVADAKHLVGAFNAHLRDCVVLFGDEAFYAGDKKHESVLKTLVTEDVLHYEAKGVDSEQGSNYVHLLMASNNDWVVPADMDDRRFFVLDVNRQHARDTTYFGAIQAQLDNGGYEALLYYLLNLDISDFQVRNVPNTKALNEQKQLSLEPVDDWWLNKLRDGVLLNADESWEAPVQAEELYQDYVEDAKDAGVNRRGTQTMLGFFFKRVLPPNWPRRSRHKVEVVMPLENGTVYTKRETRIHFQFPPLAECRQKWDELFGTKTEWPEATPVEAAPGREQIPF